MKQLFTLVVGAALVAGCADRGPVEVSSQLAVTPGIDAAAVVSSPGIKVMTYNVYYGTNADPLLTVTDQNQIPFLAAGVWALQATNFPERAGALAAEIAQQRPHLVGLQEAALYRIQDPSDFSFFPPNAQDTVFDFLQLLVDSLAAHGAQYVVASADATTSIDPRVSCCLRAQLARRRPFDRSDQSCPPAPDGTPGRNPPQPPTLNRTHRLGERRPGR